MLLDIMLGVPLLIFILLGLRDGIVRKLVASIVFIGGLFLGQIYMHDVGNYLAENGWVNSTNAPMYGFLTIFILLAIAQGIIYKVLAGSYKIGGIADRVGGLVFGFIEGVIFLSSLLFIFALAGTPSRETALDSQFYKPIVNIAPQILDFTSTTGQATINKIKKGGGLNNEKGILDDKLKDMELDSATAINLKKQNEIINKAREAGRKSNQ